MNNADKPIYPSTEITKSDVLGHELTSKTNHRGLTKREHASIEAMKALISNPNIKRPGTNDVLEYDKFSKVAIEYADSLLKQLETK